MSLFTIILIIFCVLLLPTAYAGWIGAPYAPTFTPAIKRALKKIKLGPGDTLIDLGAGDGKVVIEATKLGATGIGYELSPIMWFIAWVRIKFRKRVSPLLRGGARGGENGKLKNFPSQPGSAHMYLRNFYNKKLPDATVIFIFLMPDKMKRVHEYLKKQKLPNGKYILAYSFPFPDVTPQEIIETPKCGKIYVYNLRKLQKTTVH